MTHLHEYQNRVDDWMLKCFDIQTCIDTVERNYRFLEEALELVQSLGCTKEDVTRLVDYVYSRPAGEPAQEVGGVMVTLSALCTAAQICLDTNAGKELNRVWQNIEKIRHKHYSKTIRSPLLGTSYGPHSPIK